MSIGILLSRVRAAVAFVTILSLVLSSVAVIPPTHANAAGACVVNINCIDNPSFETVSGGVPTGWSDGSYGTNNASATITTATTSVHTGLNAGQITVTSYTDGDAKWVFTPVPVTPGQTYTFTDWYKSATSTEVDIFFTTSAGDVFQWLENVPAATNWTQLPSKEIFVPAGATAMTVAHILVGTGTLTTDDYSLLLNPPAATFSQGLVTLTFDDGWESFNQNAKPILNTATSTAYPNGLRSTDYIITGVNGSNIGGTPNQDYMSTAELTALQTAGYDIEAHTRAHLDLVNDNPTSFGYANYSAMLQGEINGSRTDLLSHGFTPVDTFAYPYGSYDAAVEASTSAAGFIAARSVDQGYNSADTDRYALKIQPINDQTTVATAKSWIDYAIANKVWLIIMFHNVRATTTADVAAGANDSGSVNDQCIEDVTDANGNPVTPPQTERDTDCTTTAVLQGIVDYLKTTPANTVQTMHQVLTGSFVVPPPDTTAPTIAITTPANGSTITTATTTISGTTDDNTSAVKFSLNNKFYTVTPSGGIWSLALPNTDALANGSYTINASSTDTSSNTGNATAVSFTVALAPINAAPVANSQIASTTKNVALPLTLTATDTDSLILTYATTSNPLHGTLSGTAPNLIYTPATDYVGSDLFTFTANDGTSTSNTATVSITIGQTPNHVPVATAQSVSLTKNTNATITLAATDADNDPLTFATSSNPAHGTLTGSGSTLTYTPATDYVGSDSFNFVAKDATSTSVSSTVSITVNDVVVTPPPSSGGGSSGGGGGGGGGGGSVLGLIGTVVQNGTGLVLGASTQVLTDSQINAILDLLRSFNADQSVIDSVSNALHGGSTVSGGATVFTHTLQVGSTGAEVSALQSRLTLEGVYSGPITGYFGPLTKAGVIAYQNKYGITPPVGIVGPKTRTKLNGQ